ncbi:hypothetical protein DTO027B5_375 [Paecilomyces variotii]|nr:hypothetical protein DTO212C5_3844 [Paecilomyces variotii]KAJ9291166.1 hypothetical protein DTO021C3_1382 [Paecilomyces variotii]KAJ9324598.1 hypothetical protein DTO027B3_4348 [Paecilomyces variotii]KAJ9338223.1 hypothetical protein DTO027B5_375 [Paecilomyces variotii]
MGLGVLEDDHLEHIPGTALLRDVMENQTSVLRHEQGRNTDVILDDTFWKVLIRSLMMLVFSQVIFSFFAYGLTTSWLVVVRGVLAQLFAVPLYNFSVSGVGLVTIAPLIGAIIGAFISVNRIKALNSA